MFRYLNKKAGLAQRIEAEAELLDKISKENIEKRLKEESILDNIVVMKTYFADHCASIYLNKLTVLTNDELFQFGLQILQGGIVYIKELGMVIKKEDVTMYQRVLGIMLYDLSDSIANMPTYLQNNSADREKIHFEILLILQFIYAYEDYENIQNGLLCVPFVSFKNTFPPGFLIDKQP